MALRNCIILSYILLLCGCGESIARGVVAGGVDAVQDKIAVLTKEKQEAETKADAAIKTSVQAESRVAELKQTVANDKTVLAQHTAELQSVIAKEDALYRAEVAHSIRVWSVVAIISGMISAAIGFYLAISSAATPLGIMHLILCKGTSGKSLRVIGYVAIGLGAICFVCAPAWYGILWGIVGAIALGVVAALIYEAEHHKGAFRDTKGEVETLRSLVLSRTDAPKDP